MYLSDESEFTVLMRDLCTATGVKFTDDLRRVFWQDLQDVPLREVQRCAYNLRRKGVKSFRSADLRPSAKDIDAAASTGVVALDNHERMRRLCDYVTQRLWERLTIAQRIKPRTFVADRQQQIVAVRIEADGESGGYHVTLADTELLDTNEMQERASARDFASRNEAQDVTDLLNRGKTT